MKTVGVSPKLILAVVGAIVSYLLTQEVLEFPAWVEVLLNAGAVALGAAVAGPGTVQRRHTTGEAGYTLIEVAVGLLVLFIALAILVRYVL